MRALLSVSDKRNLPSFAGGLAALGYTLIASGGTARTLRQAGLDVIPVADLTGFPELLGGRVKTLHPAVHAGILARRTPEDRNELAKHGIDFIDLVVVNLYPFEETVARPSVTLEEAVEQIDIGGVALLRAAAKNFAHVTVICDPDDYEEVLERLQSGTLDMAERRRLAIKAFRHTATYDAAIATYLSPDGTTGSQALIDRMPLLLQRQTKLRYGENPHQRAALYLPIGQHLPFRQLHGKEMSYNNWLDLDTAWRAAHEFDSPTVAIIKHGNPCGLATASTLREAYEQALASDPVSAFGSVIAVNRPLDADTAQGMRKLFIEVLAAPSFTEEALRILKRKSRFIRLLQAIHVPATGLLWRNTVSGWLAQTPDALPPDPSAWRVVTERRPSDEEWEGLRFGWQAIKHVKSNAIVFAKGKATVGVGAGQMSRVDAVRLAAWKAGVNARGAVMASDAFFPFPDGVEVAAEAGITAVIQPGGSKRDGEVIAAANRLGMAMVFTGVRHFRH